jgi:hypothetical protein
MDGEDAYAGGYRWAGFRIWHRAAESRFAEDSEHMSDLTILIINLWPLSFFFLLFYSIEL